MHLPRRRQTARASLFLGKKRAALCVMEEEKAYESTQERRVVHMEGLSTELERAKVGRIIALKGFAR